MDIWRVSRALISRRHVPLYRTGVWRQDGRVFAQGASGDQNPCTCAATNDMASRSGVTITGNVLTREKVEAPLRDGKVEVKPLDPKVRDALERVMEPKACCLGKKPSA